ncbi:MAG: Coenzyme F420 hydrogenase/dehydrogenase, beta subunit C-terminal domain, partial [Blautia sp.]|nr:Coenzyme F420 hydrogenase/dehydrogenase, beta subunit C-terminal domain [Blautia sp.]
VLFTGTPCQTLSVKRFWEAAGGDRQQLLLVDNICHGASSPGTWRDYLEILKGRLPRGEELLSVNMRPRQEKESKKARTLVSSKGRSLEEGKSFSYRKLYAAGVITRRSCYACPFACEERGSDITLGDFWNAKAAGLKGLPKEGISEVLLNTSQGRDAFEKLSLLKEETSLQKAWQPHLSAPMACPKGRKAFWNSYLAGEDKEGLFAKTMKGSLMGRMIQTLMPILQETGLYVAAGKVFALIKGRRKP